jgi:hypothetical protein
MSLESEQTFLRSIAHAAASHRTDVACWLAIGPGNRVPFAAGPARRNGFEIELDNGQVFHVVVTEMAPKRKQVEQ